MKFDVLIIRVSFVLLLALMGYLINPLAKTTHIDTSFETRQILSAIIAIIFAGCVIAFEMRARKATLKTLIGAAIGSILGIIGAYLIGMLISSQETTTVSGEIKTFLTIALA